MNRRQFASTLGAAVAGIVAGKALLADDKPAEAPSPRTTSAQARTHVRARAAAPRRTTRARGQNACKGKGGCATASMKHDCAGKNECKGAGRLQPRRTTSAPARTRARAKGGCAVPAQEEGRAGGAEAELTPLPMGDRFGLPDLGVGVGLRTVHFGHILSKAPEVDFFEALTENFLDTGGRPRHVLDRVAERYPIVLHGVSMSIGGTDPLDLGYLRKVKALAARDKARWVSDHLCFTGVSGRNTHDLLPLPYTEETLRHVVSRVKKASDVLEQPLVLENPSSYLEFRSSTMSEAAFFARLLGDADCGMLLDVNNVYVSSVNHGFDPVAYLDALPHDRVVQYHLAGHTDKGTHLLDTHSARMKEEVWRLYAHAIALTGPRATLFEWDEDIPDFETVHGEAKKALRYRPPLARESRVDAPRRAAHA